MRQYRYDYLHSSVRQSIPDSIVSTPAHIWTGVALMHAAVTYNVSTSHECDKRRESEWIAKLDVNVYAVSIRYASEPSIVVELLFNFSPHV